MKLLRYAFLLLASAAALGVAFLTYLETSRVDLSLATKPTAPKTASERPGALTYRFLGNANLLLSDGETSILTDGWFSRFPTRTLAFGLIEPDLKAIEAGLMRAEITELAAVIPVHSHFDHAMDSPEVALRTGALLVGSESSANIARGWGLNEDRIRVPQSGETLRFGAFEVTLIQSDHFQFPSEYARKSGGLGEFITAPLTTPAKVGDYKEGGSYSVLIRHPQATILIQGSAGFVEGALDGVDVDLLFLGVGGLGGQTDAYQRAYWKHVASATSPETIVPIHFDSLTAPLGEALTPPNRLWSNALGMMAQKTIADFEALAAENDTAVVFPELWKKVEISALLKRDP